MTITEVVVATFLILGVMTSSYLLIIKSSELSRSARRHYIAISLAKNRLERARNFLYDDLKLMAETDLTVDDNGNPDAAKITEQINDLLTRKPHLGRPSFGGRFGVQDGSLGGGHPGGQSEADRVKALVAEMQSSTGVKVPAQQ